MSVNSAFATVILWLITFGFTNNGLHTNFFTIIVVSIYFTGRRINKSIRRKRYKTSDFEKERLESIETLMKEPKGVEITDYEERIRRNLLFTSFLALIFTWFNLQVSGDSKFFGGISFTNLKPEMIYFLLLLLVSYEFIHYFWHIHNNLMHWRVRLTGTSHPEIRGDGGSGVMGMGNSPHDHLGKDENSNFYTWMFENKRDRTDAMTNMIETSESLKKVIDNFGNNQTSSHKQNINQLATQANELIRVTVELTKAVECIRVDSSLLRFDQYFRLLVSSQNRRWLILDVTLPFLLGVSAFCSLIASLFFGWKADLFNV